MWQNPELKARAKTYNSKAMQQYGLTPQAFYDQKLKPLLYLGFLPKSIVRYKLLNMSAGSIGRLIRNFCTETDKQQYAENKKMAVGSNHSYIAFLEVQYKTHFAAKLPDFSTLRNSKVLKKYGMLPHEYYAQKLKPLLYLGFPPSAMLRYKLVNLSLNGVVRMIKKFGSPEDLAQYKSNVTKVGGGSKTYNKFLDSQYLKYAGEDS